MYQCKLLISDDRRPSLENQINSWLKSMRKVKSFDLIDIKLSINQTQAIAMAIYCVVEDENT